MRINLLTTPFVTFVTLSAMIVGLQACSGPSGGAARDAAIPAAGRHAAHVAPPIGNYIKHIVIVIQENRSMPNLFAGFPGADAPQHGFSVHGKRIPLQERTFDGPDILHTWGASMADWDNGKMDGFDTSIAYGFMKRSLVKPYWDMAKQYVLADRMFPTEFGPSFTAHLSLIAGTTNITPREAEVNYPDGAWRCSAVPGTTSSLVTKARIIKQGAGPFPCLTQFNTMAEVLDDANVSWRYYAPPIGHMISWSAFDAIEYVWDGPDWAKDIVNPQTRFLTDASAGNLPAVTWVVPDFTDSDHAGSKSDTGPSWVSAIVNSVGQGPDWNSTAIVVVWDDWGGWYDDVPPPQKDFRGLGIRVPCLIISPYAKKGYVSHTQYEFGSILKFVEQTFNLPGIGENSFGSGYTDARATSLSDSFDFTQAPRPYVKIPAKYPIAHFLSETPSYKLPDDI